MEHLDLTALSSLKQLKIIFLSKIKSTKLLTIEVIDKKLLHMLPKKLHENYSNFKKKHLLKVKLLKEAAALALPVDHSVGSSGTQIYFQLP